MVNFALLAYVWIWSSLKKIGIMNKSSNLKSMAIISSVIIELFLLPFILLLFASAPPAISFSEIMFLTIY